MELFEFLGLERDGVDVQFDEAGRIPNVSLLLQFDVVQCKKLLAHYFTIKKINYNN